MEFTTPKGTSPPFDEVVAFLRRRLAAPLPGVDAQLRLAPSHRDDPAFAAPGDRPCRDAAVLVLLFPLAGQPALVLTVRRDDLRRHAGQISFPGGRRDPGEDLPRTALREAEEEVNVDPGEVELLGSLTALFVPPSNYCVYPFVGTMPYEPELTPHDAEVKAILHVPLGHLLHPETLTREPRTIRGFDVDVPFFAFGHHKVWGATAMMLSELLAVVGEIAPRR